MSVFGDFQRVWLQRFPQSRLPAAWEEDVRANLSKHKQKVALLKEELEKEEFYVEYLERLLSDVEEHKKNSAPPQEEAPPDSTTEDNKDNTKEKEEVRCEVSNVTTTNNESKNNENNKTVTTIETNQSNQCSVTNVNSEQLTSSANSNVDVRRSHSICQQNVNVDIDKTRRNTDPSNFVTVIEVNGLNKSNNKTSESSPEIPNAKRKVPPKPPPKNIVKREHSLPETDNETPSSDNARSKESLVSSNEQLNTDNADSHSRSHSGSLDSVSHTYDSHVGDEEPEEEPYYDSVAADSGEYVYIQGGNRKLGSHDDVSSSNASTLPMPAPRSHTSSLASVQLEPESPGKSSNYVNIEYFIQKRSNLGGGDTRSSSDGECEDGIEDGISCPPLLRAISVDPEAHEDETSYASSSSLESATPSSRRKFLPSGDLDGKAEAERMTMYRCIISNIIESETSYVECLSIMTQYMRAMKAALGSSQSVITEDEYNTIFYKIPELHKLHSNFLDTLKKQSINWDCRIGNCFKEMAANLILYGAFLHNYSRATDTVRKCCANNVRFNEIAMNIKLGKSVSGQSISLEDLLHKPVARVQKNALVLHDLLKYTPPNHSDYRALNDALNMTQHFLDEFNTIQTKNMFPQSDRAQRRLIKNSFIVELVDGQRKLRHLFLFNDVIACAKYKVSSGRHEKYTFELKWFIPLGDIMILEENFGDPREYSPANIVQLKSQACTVRDQILLEEKSSKNSSSSRTEKIRKKVS